MAFPDGSDGVGYAVFYDGLLIGRFRKGKWEKMTWKDVKPYIQSVFGKEPDGVTKLDPKKFSAKALSIKQYKKSIKLQLEKGLVVNEDLSTMSVEEWKTKYNNMKKGGQKDG